MICKACGNTIDENARFCNKCGAEQREKAEAELSSKNVGGAAKEHSEKNENHKKTIILIGTTVSIILAVFLIYLILINAKIIENPISKKRSEIDKQLENISELNTQERISFYLETNIEKNEKTYGNDKIAENDDHDTTLKSEDVSEQIQDDWERTGDTEQDDYEDRDIEDNYSKVNSQYILPDIDRRYYDKSEIEELSVYELRIARNEIYARHGRRFKSEDLQEYFSSKNWYDPRTDEINDSELNKFEIANRDLIVSVEKTR